MSRPHTLVFQSTPELQIFLATEGRGGCHLVSPTATIVGVFFQMVGRSQVARDAGGDASQRPISGPVASSGCVSRDWRIMAVAISASEKENYVLDLDKLDPLLVLQVLQELLEDGRKIKVMHDIHVAARWLDDYGLKSVTLRKCIDIQLAYEVYVNTRETAVSSETLQSIRSGPTEIGTAVLAVLLEYDDMIPPCQGPSVPSSSPATTNSPGQCISAASSFTWGANAAPSASALASPFQVPVSSTPFAVPAPSGLGRSFSPGARYATNRPTATRRLARARGIRSEAMNNVWAATGGAGPSRSSGGRSPAPSASPGVMPSSATERLSSVASIEHPSTLFSGTAGSAESEAGAPVSTPAQDEPSSTEDPGNAPAAGSIDGGVPTSSTPKREEPASIEETVKPDKFPAAATADTAPNDASIRSTADPSDTFAFSFQGLVDALPQQSPSSTSKTSVPTPLATYAEPREQQNGYSVFGSGHRSNFAGSFRGVKDPLTPGNPQFNNRVRSLALAAALIRTRVQVLATTKKLMPSIFSMTARRWASAITNLGHPSIVFDSLQDFTPRSPESLLTPPEASEPLRIACDTSALFASLPPRIQRLIKANTDDCLTGVTDICLDAGKLPVLIVDGKHKKLHDGSASPTVTRRELESILVQGSRDAGTTEFNRACLQSLHRVAVIRAATVHRKVNAITLRVGRVVRNKASMLTDLVFAKKHQHKSIFILGRPRSGKSTLLRDIVRLLSNKQDDVYVVDTWNELGGAAADAHECLGMESRRCMVPSRELQAAVIRGCVQNHCVRTLIVDEVELDDDFAAIWSAKQHGVRLIVGMKGLVHTVGGSAYLSRGGRCLFEPLVELDSEDFTAVKVMADYAGAPREVVRTRQTRLYNSATHSVNI